VIGSVPQRKRTVEVCLPNLTIRPQEPRRPRFPFFHLHNFKEQTPGASFEGGVVEAFASRTGEQTWFRLPGSRSALSVIVEQWERVSLGVVNVAGSSRGRLACQHPIFKFRSDRNLKTREGRSLFCPSSESQNFFCFSVVCFGHRRVSAPPPQRWAVYRGAPFWCQHGKSETVKKISIFPSAPSPHGDKRALPHGKSALSLMGRAGITGADGTLSIGASSAPPMWEAAAHIQRRTPSCRKCAVFGTDHCPSP
jgi:hypothetical protein